jgi:hypothetical protein
MGRAMTKPLCYPRANEHGLEVVTQGPDGRLTVSHKLNFAECKTMAENCIAQMQRLYAKDKCQCD